MIAAITKRGGFMFPEKDVSQWGIYIPHVGKLGKHTFPGTFTTGKPDVSRVSRNGCVGKLGKLENTHGANGWTFRKAVRR